MSLVTINGVGVLSGTILMPLVGVWTADLVIDQPDGTGFGAGTTVAIAAAGGFTLTGAVAADRTGYFLDAAHVRVLGGAGGMGKPATPRSFAEPGAFASDVIAGLMADSGETLSSTADGGFTGTDLTAWSVFGGGTVSDALRALIATVAPSDDWRLLPDGSLWIGAETWPDTAAEYELLEQNPSEKTFDLGVDTLTIVPGIAISGIGQINRVEHQIEPNKIRSRTWTTVAGDEQGFRPFIASIVSQETGLFDYHALYDFRVITQSADLATVDVVPSDSALAAKLGQMGRVPLRHGLPGMSVVVPQGAIIRVGWDRGNPSKPFACIYNGGEATAWTLNGDFGYQHSIANAAGLVPITVAPGLGVLGAGGTATLSFGHDEAFQIVLNTDPAATGSSGQAATVTLERLYKAGIAVISQSSNAPFDATAIPGPGWGARVITNSNTLAVLTSGKLAVAGSYPLNIMVKDTAP